MAESAGSSGTAARLGLVLGALTMLATALNAIPAFLALRGHEPHVVYQVDRAQMLYPQDADRSAIRKLLRENRIPDAFVSVVLSNRGDAPAREVIVGITVPGIIVAEKTDPEPDSRPAWVKITRESEVSGTSRSIRYVLRDLGLTRNLAMKVSYAAESLGDARFEIFSDGKPAVLVNDLASVPANARAISFAPTFKILGTGMLLSLVAYLFLRYRGGLRTIVLILAGMPPQRASSAKWARYRDEIVLRLATQSGAALSSFADGSMRATRPTDFWDAVLTLGPCKLAVDVHMSDQGWLRHGSEDPMRWLALRIHTMARALDVTHVALVNDENVWAGQPAVTLVNTLRDLAGGDGHPTYVFASGSPEEVARTVMDSLKGSST